MSWQPEKKRRTVIIVIPIVVLLIAVGVALLLDYFEIAWQSALNVSLYVLLIAGQLAFLTIFIFGLRQLTPLVTGKWRRGSRAYKQQVEAPDSMCEKISEILDSVSRLSGTAEQIAIFTGTQFIRLSYKERDKTTSRSKQEKLLIAIDDDIKTLVKNLENIRIKVVNNERLSLSQTGSEGRAQTPQRQYGRVTQTTQQPGSARRNYSENTQTALKTPDDDKVDHAFEIDNKTHINSIVDNYAQAIIKPVRQQQFMEKYSPTILDTENANARLQNPELTPVFTKSPQGNFMAIQTDRKDLFLIVPKFNFVLKDTNYGTGAVNEVFECQGYHAGFKYTQVELIKPAVFNHQSGNWSIKTPGILHLGPGE